jgi:hypothetical protein
MKVVEIGTRSGPLAFMDMSGRSKPAAVRGHNVFRIGDRAAAHLWLLHWRKLNPEARIIVIDDPLWNRVQGSYLLDTQWLFNGIADELWIADKFGETIAIPQGTTLYHTKIWGIWEWLRKNCCAVPSIRPTTESLERAAALLQKHSVPECYVTVQPLFDAPYNKFRNAPVSWWETLVQTIAKRLPVVVLGAKANVKPGFAGPNVFPLWTEDLTPMDSLALMKKGYAHVGGETGLTLWAGLLHVPTLALYSSCSASLPEVRPIGFKAEVRVASLKMEMSILLKTLLTLIE